MSDQQNVYLANLIGTTAELLLPKYGYCPCFAMYLNEEGVHGEVMPDTVEEAGLDPGDRESYFSYLKQQIEPLKIVSAAVATSAQIVPDPAQPPKDALVVFIETTKSRAMHLVRPYELHGEEVRYGEHFAQEAEDRFFHE